MTTRMKWLVGILILVTVGAAVYFSIVLAPPSAPGFNFFTGTTTPTTLPQAPGATTGGKGGTTATPPKQPSGYSVQVHGKTETITSTAAGVSLEAPVNSVVSQTNSILTVRPPESQNGESLSFQKTTASYGNAASQIPSYINGTQQGFDAVRSSPDSKEFNPNNNAGPAHVEKLRNLTVSGHPAVQLHITVSAGSAGPAQDFYLTWVRTGTTNWYITRSAQGLTPEVKAALDVMFNSITLSQ